MSLMKTLGKVAVGIAVAKGASALMNRSKDSGATDRHSTSKNLGGGSGGGGLGGMLSSLGGGSSSSGGLGGMLGQLTGGAAGAGGLGGMIGSLTGNQSMGATASRSEPDQFGRKLNSAFLNEGEPDDAPTEAEEAAAALMLKAMIQAAKCDGHVDQAEREKIFANQSDLSQEEREFIQREIDAPVDLEGLVRETPKGLEQQVYLMSLAAINLNNQDEAQYLDKLARALDISADTVNEIHAKAEQPALYS